MSHSAELAGKAVLVTGAAGCIGAWVVKQLRELGATPVVFDIAENRERLDLIMPEVDGFEVLAWIRERQPALDVPVVVLTASPSKRDMERARELGAREVHRKPKDLDERISQLASDLFGALGDDEDWAPVPIDTADFVRRMQRFIVYN